VVKFRAWVTIGLAAIMGALPSGTAQTSMPNAPTGYWNQIAGTRRSPNIADQTWRDTQRTFVGADGQPVSIVVQSPRVRELVIAPAVEGPDDAYLTRLISDAIRSNRRSGLGRRIRFEKRTYKLNGPLLITGVNDLELDFAGSTLMFRSLRYTGEPEARSGIVISNGSRVRLRNVTITNEDSLTRPLWSVGSAFDMGTSGTAIKLDRPTGSPVPMNAISTYTDINVPWQWNDPENYREVNAIEQFIGPDGWSPPSHDYDVLAGRRVIVRHTVYGDPSVHVRSSNDVSIENIVITNSPGMGILVTQGRGLLVRNTRIERAPNQPISGSADGLHIAASGGDVIVDHNEFSYQADDALNIHAKLIPVVGSEDNRQLLWRAHGEIAEWAYRQTQPGQGALLYTSTLQYLGEARVASGPGTAGGILFAEPLPAGVAWVVINERIPRRISITNNRFHDNRGRGILFLGANAQITNNTVSRVPSVGILGLVDARKFGEGPGAVNTVISNNETSQFPGRATRHFLFDGAIAFGHSLESDRQPRHKLHGRVRVTGNRFLEPVGSTTDRPAFVQFGSTVDSTVTSATEVAKRKS
jgi:hypothetical protein